MENQQLSIEDDPHPFYVCVGIGVSAWPLTRPTVIVSQGLKDDEVLQILGMPDGSLCLQILIGGTRHVPYETDVIRAQQGFKVVLAIGRETQGADLFVELNNDLIPTRRIGGGRTKGTFLLNSPPDLALEPTHVPQHVPMNAAHEEALFIRTLGELNEASKSSDWYTLLKSSAALRLLLLDGLLDKANARHRFKIAFVVPEQDPPPLQADGHWRFITGPLKHSKVCSANVQQFLQFQLFESPEGNITLRDVIRAAANAGGGVHLGQASKHVGEQLVVQLDKTTKLMDQQVSRVCLKEICQATVDACLPLLHAIQRTG